MDKRLMGEARTLRGAFMATIAFSVGVGILIIIQAYFLSRVISDVFLGGQTLADVSGLLWVLVGVIALRMLLNAGKVITAGRLAIFIKADLRERLIKHILGLGPGFTWRERSGELSLTATEGIEALDAFFRDYLPAMFTSLLIPLMILFVVFPLDWLTFLVLVITAPLIPLFMALIGKAAGKLAKEQYGTMSRMSAHFLDVMQGLPTLKLFNRSRQQIQTIRTISDRFRETTMQVLRLAFISALVLELLATISVAIVAVEIGLRLLFGGMIFQEALFLLIIAPEFYLPLRELGAKFHTGRDGTAAADRIFTVLDTLLPDSATRDAGAFKPVPALMTLHFEDVVVSYDDRPALNGVSFHIAAGETVAIVGASGSGKSTLANLLLRFVEPDSGRILVDDTPLSALEPGAWREHLAWTPQQPYLFNRSAAGNIRLSRPDASDSDVQQAAKEAHAHHFISRLEAGYDTPLGERGARLSGGQAQRIALARAFLKDTPLMIFDEATASLDEITEATVMHNIQRITRERTTLIIAHRLNTIVDADRILVMDSGRIVQEGTHDDLAAQNGVYRNLINTFDPSISPSTATDESALYVE